MPLYQASKAYTLFVTEQVELEGEADWLYRSRKGRRIAVSYLSDFLLHEARNYFPKPYGEKFNPGSLAISRDFKGSVRWNGNYSVCLNVDFGEKLCQAAFWRNNIPVFSGQCIDLWLEYRKDPGVRIALTVTQFVQGSIDAVAAFTHPYGCSQMGEDQENTRKILADMIHHPNAGGILVLGLGCENSNIPVLTDYIGDYDRERVRFLQCQDVEDEIGEGIKLLEELADCAGGCRREKIDAGELIVGMKCGGSDGLSGITANPVVGAFSDILCSKGGTTILTEVPEMFGAETILMNRCETQELFAQTVDLINDFKNYFKRHDQTIYENPSPGNKKGGISTLEDKSLGCTQKSGNAPVKGVLAYTEPVKVKGLNLLSAPGNDLVASTALAMSGAQIVLFTTGRGTPFASPVPTIKISSNTRLAKHKEHWIDFNAGRMVEDRTKGDLAEALFQFVLDVASGKPVKAEEAGFHDWAIFKQGVTL